MTMTMTRMMQATKITKSTHSTFPKQHRSESDKTCKLVAKQFRQPSDELFAILTPITSLSKPKNGVRFSLNIPLSFSAVLGVVIQMDKTTHEPFETLRVAFTSVFMLRHFDLRNPVVLETNASGQVLSRVVSQTGDNRIQPPITYYSHK